jgi:hypothetical protein
MWPSYLAAAGVVTESGLIKTVVMNLLEMIENNRK